MEDIIGITGRDRGGVTYYVTTSLKICMIIFRFITWIDRDPETIARQEALKKRDKLSKDDEERMAEFIQARVRPFDIEVVMS